MAENVALNSSTKNKTLDGKCMSDIGWHSMPPITDKTASRNFQNFTQSVELLNQYRTALFPPDFQDAELFENVEIAVHAAATLEQPNQLTGAELLLYLKRHDLTDRGPFEIMPDAAAAESPYRTTPANRSICSVSRFQDFTMPTTGLRSHRTLPKAVEEREEKKQLLSLAVGASKKTGTPQLTGAELMQEANVSPQEYRCEETIPLVKSFFRAGLAESILMARAEMPVWQQTASMASEGSPPLPQPPLGDTGSQPVFPPTGSGATYEWDPKTGRVYRYTPPVGERLTSVEIRDIPNAIVAVGGFVYDSFPEKDNYRMFFSKSEEVWSLVKAAKIPLSEPEPLVRGLEAVPDVKPNGWQNLEVKPFKTGRPGIVRRAFKKLAEAVKEGVGESHIQIDVKRREFNLFKTKRWLTAAAWMVSGTDYVYRKINKRGLEDSLADAGIVPDRVGGELAMLGGVELLQTGIGAVATAGTAVTGAALAVSAGASTALVGIPALLLLEEAHIQADADLRLQTELATGKLYLTQTQPTSFTKQLVGAPGPKPLPATTPLWVSKGSSPGPYKRI